MGAARRTLCERALDGDGINASPSGYLRWDLAPNLRLGNRGLGFQLEYRQGVRWELFTTAFRASDRFQLDRRPGGPAGTTFRDREVLGGGVVLKIYQALRVFAEIGAIVDRLDSADGNVSPYFSFRAEARP